MQPKPTTRTVAIALLILLLSNGACFLLPDDGIACTAIFVYGLNVTLTAEDTSAPISGATLVIREGAFSETMMELTPSIDPGKYVGAGERAGTYTIDVSAAGFVSKTIVGIQIGEDICHVIPETLDVELTRE
jgi:hypothetical protein